MSLLVSSPSPFRSTTPLRRASRGLGLLALSLLLLATASPHAATAVPPADAVPQVGMQVGVQVGREPAPAAVSARAGSFTPVTRAMFNNPLGNEDEKRRLFRHLIKSADATPRGGVIRFAVFSFADKATADALLRAHARGVDVKLLFAGSNVYAPMRRMQAALGKNPSRDSFAIFCRNSCRGDKGQMHAKFFSYSEVGRARHVTMVGSNNLTRHNSHDQWSDLYTVAGDKAYYQTFARWFTQAKRDRPRQAPYIDRRLGSHRISITPVSLKANPDPLVQALDSVTCRTRTGPTKLLLGQHAWNGPRGKRLAMRVAGLSRAGCEVRVFYGEGVGPAVRNILRRSDARLRNGTHRGVLTHQKLLIVNGHVGGDRNGIRVWTGSQNWTTRALVRDDVLVEIDDQEVGRQYVKGFWRMWTKG